MIKLEDLSKESSESPNTLQVLGISLVSLTQNRYNIVFNRGIHRSLLKDLIHIYRSEILNWKEGKITDSFGIFTVYIHFYTIGEEKISLFYINEKEMLVNYEKICSISNLLVKTYCTNISRSKIGQICNPIIPIAKGVTAFLVISTTGQTLFAKIRNDKKKLLENSIQIGGFLSAILMFSNEVIGKKTGENLKAIAFENHKFLISVEEGTIFAYLLEQSTNSNTIERYIELLTEEFIELYYDCLKDFDGDIDQFQSFGAVVDNYFSI